MDLPGSGEGPSKKKKSASSGAAADGSKMSREKITSFHRSPVSKEVSGKPMGTHRGFTEKSPWKNEAPMSSSAKPGALTKTSLKKATRPVFVKTLKTAPPSQKVNPPKKKGKTKGSIASSAKPQTAVKKKKRKLGQYNLVPKRKVRGNKQDKKVEPVVVPVPEKTSEAVNLKPLPIVNPVLALNEPVLETGEYTELDLESLDLKAQEELLSPQIDFPVTELDLAEELPLCCCRMETPYNGGSLSALDHTCMAMESYDGLLSCCPRRVLKQEMMRPSNTVHLLVLCEDHRAGMVKHQCCPGCGLFCRAGTFMECRPYGNISHRFHRDCASILKDRRFCPHCGEDTTGAKEVTLPKPEPSVPKSSPGPSLPTVARLPSVSTTPAVPQTFRAKKTFQPPRNNVEPTVSYNI